MQLLLLHLDDALELQPDFVGAALEAGAHEVSEKAIGSHLRLWARRQVLDELSRRLVRATSRKAAQPRLCFLGSGDFHHVTVLLLEQALERAKKPVTVIHIDNHPDWVCFDAGIHCGSWVNKALDNQLVRKVITLGVCSSDLASPERKGANLELLRSQKLELFPYSHPPSRVRGKYGSGPGFDQLGADLHWHSILQMGDKNFIDRLLDRIDTDDVYITIDKDALCRDDAVTNWDQGKLRLDYVLSLLSEIGFCHRIIGADVTGDYSVPHYGGSLLTQAFKRAEILIDQPRLKHDRQSVREINTAANQALLESLMGLMS
ncbi:arginase [Rhizobium vallis]|uniref:Arginase n=1 Tax=Rhizobium vallis TaxID=634290 RepID=A0A3S0QWE1_9HYPH|nr:arginase family protein [Rhizobium vallis]RUM25844.1 arginase [Rhizobium vallis]